MPSIINKKQQVRGFIWLLASFFVIFSILASVIFLSYTRTVFQSADNAINEAIRLYDNQGLLSTSDNNVKKSQPIVSSSTRADTWSFDKNGKLIVDTSVTDPRQKAMQKALQATVKFKKSTLTDKAETYKIAGNYYRVIGVKFKKNAAKSYDTIAANGLIMVNVIFPDIFFKYFF